jgi:fibronectin-binding autotransporter adhesin
MQHLSFVSRSLRNCWLSGAIFLLLSITASAQLTWDANTGVNGPQNTDGTANTLIWNTTNANWWNGTADTTWVNSTTAIAQIGTSIPTPASSNPISITENITLQELRFLAVTTGSIASGQQYALNGSTPGITLDFGTNGIISMEDRSSGGSQFIGLGTNLRLKSNNLRFQKYGTGTTFMFINMNMTTNPELTGTLTVGGSIYLGLVGPTAIQNVSRVVVEAGGSIVTAGTGTNYTMPFTLAGYGNSLLNTSTAYGAIRMTASNVTLSGGILLSADAGINNSSSGSNATGIVINAPITDGGGNFAFSHYAFNGNGTLSLAAANTYGGATMLGKASTSYTGSITILDFTAASSPQNDILYNGLTTPGALTLFGGVSVTTLRLTGKDGQTHSQRFGNVTVGGTYSSVEMLAGVGGNINVSLGTVTQTTASATLAIYNPLAANSLSTTTTGFLGPWASYTGELGRRSWAQGISGQLSSGYAGSVVYTTGGSLSTSPFSSTANATIDNTSTGTVSLGSGSTFLNTLSMNDLLNSRQVGLGTGQTLRLGTSGGIQIVNGALNLTVGISGQTSTLSAGGSVTNTAGTLFLSNLSDTSTLTINSNITNNGTGLVTLVVNSAPNSHTILTGTNTYTGGTRVDSGILEIRSSGALGTSGTVTLTEAAGATLGLSGGITLNRALAGIAGLGDGNNGAIRSLSGSNTISALITQVAPTFISADAGASLTISATTASTTAIDGAFGLTLGGAGTITVTGRLNIGGTSAGTLTKTGTGLLLLSGDNTYAATTTVSAGTLKLGSTTALGATTGVTISAGATVDLNGQTTDRIFSSINGTGVGILGALINSSGTTAIVTGTTALSTATNIGGSGNITISNATGLTGSVLLTKLGSGTLTVIDSTTTSARSGVNEIDAGTLRIQSTLALAPIGAGAYALNGGTLSLGFDATNTMTNLVNVLASSTITADRASAGAGGIVHSLGALTIGGTTLTVTTGASVTSSTIGLTLGTTTIGGASLAPGNPTFDVQSSANAALTLTLGALSDQAIVPRTITFQNSGTAASSIILGTAATSLVDGTLVNLASTGGALTLNLNLASALGTLSQVSVGSGNTLNLGAAQTFGSLSGSGNITGSFVLTVGSGSTASALNTIYSGVLGFGGVGTGLTKAGLGTLTLSGANAYTGATIISLGTLKLNNTTALGATSGVTISAGGTVDLNGQTTDRTFTSITGAGFSNGGAIINSSATTGTITGSVALAAVSSIGGSGSITLNNATGLTGNAQLTKIGSGTLTIIDTTTTSARTGANQINAGTLRLESAALTATSPIGTSGAWTLNGGTLSLGFDTANNLITGAITLNGNAAIVTDVATLNNAAVTQTLGGLTFINNSTLTVQTGANVISGGTQGLTLGGITFNGNATFDVQNTATATTKLTLGAWTDLAITPRTINFSNTGAAATNSLVTVGSTSVSVVDGTVVNLNSGTNAGVTVVVTAITGMGAMPQVTVNGNSVLTAGVSSIVLGSLSGTGTVNTNTTATLTIGNSSSYTASNTNFSGVFGNGTGTLTLIKAGLNTLTLDGSASNTATGALTVNSGTLILAKTGGATAVAGALTIGAAAASTAGNATLKLQASDQLAASTTALVLNSGSTVNLNGFNMTVLTLSTSFGTTITGSGILAVNQTSGTMTWTGFNTISSSSTLQLTAAGAAAGRTLAMTNVTDQLTINGNITQGTNAGSIVAGNSTQTALGTLILAGNNSYTGTTTVSSGILNIRSATALGTTTGSTSVTNGATLQIQGSITTLAEVLTLNGGSGFAGSNGINTQTGALVNVSGVNNYAGAITLATSTVTISSDNGTLNLTSAGTITGSGIGLILAGAGDGSISSIIGTAAGIVTKNGTGTWTLKGVNTSTGGIVINAGTLKLGNGTTGKWSNALALTYTGSGTFEYGGATAASTQALGALTISSGSGVLKVDAPASGTNSVTFTSLVTPSLGTGLNIVSPASTSVTITGTTNTNGIIDPRITYNGADFAASTSGLVGASATTSASSSMSAGNLNPYLITGSFTQTASTTVNAGLKFTGGNTLTISNGTLLTINNGVNADGGILIAGGVAAVIADEGTSLGLTTGGGGDLIVGTNATGDSLSIQVSINSTSTGGLTKNGAGTLTLTVANAYTGATSINAGTLILANAAAMSTSTATVQVGAVLDLNGQVIINTAVLNGTGSGTGALVNNSATAAAIGALTIGLGNGTGSIGASIGGTGNIATTGTLTGDNLLVKTGAGTLTVGDNGGTALASTRVGATRIDAGTLRISNSTSALGTASAAIILNGGTLSLGSTASVVAYPVSVTASSTIISDVYAAGAGLTHTLGVLAIGTQTLTIQAGSNVTTASTNAGIIFGATTLLGSPTFDVQSPTTVTSGTTTLTLGALSDQGVAKTITFTNSGTSTINSSVILGAAMASLVDGTLVNINSGTSAGVTLNLNIAAALGTLAQVTVSGKSMLSLGAAETIGSLSGDGNVIGAFVLTIGNANSSTALNTIYSGVFGFGAVATGLTKAGLGTLTLSGANAYTGATVVTLGTLKLNNATALGATTGVTISAGGTLDLNGQTTDRSFTSISGAGASNVGALINSSSTTGTITGNVSLVAVSSIGGSGNITINNTTGLTGNVQFTKIGPGTLTIIDTTTTSARTGANQINAGTLRLESAALTAVSPLGTSGLWTLNGGTLSLGFDTANALMTGAITLNGNATIVTDVATLNNAAVTQTLGALIVNNGSTLTVQSGSNVVTGGTQGLTLNAITLNGNVTFDVQSTSTVTTKLTLGALGDLAITPRTITFANTGTSTTNSQVVLATAASSLVDGTTVNISNGTNSGVTLNLNIAAALGTLAQVTVSGNSVLNLGVAQTIASLAGDGNVTGAFVLTVGNASNSTALNTNYSGVLGFGGVATALTKSGLGSLTLSGANAYTGATIVSLGILKLNNATALGATTGVTISAGGTVDLNGQSTDRNFTSISGTGHNGGGAIINSSTTTATITGTTVLGAASKIGGSGNITVNNVGGLTGSVILTKFGSGTLTFISTSASARTGVNQIDGGTLRLQSANAIATLGTGAMALNGGTLSLGYDAGGTVGGVVNLLSDSTIIVDRASAGAGGYALTLGALTISSNTLTVKAGANVTGTMGLTLGAVSIGGASMQPGNPIFDVQSTASATTTLTLAALNDQAIAPRTLTFQNSGTAASAVTLATAATSLVDGTVVNLASTGGAVTVNLNIASALGTFAQLTVGTGDTLSLGAAQTIASLNGTGTVSATVDSTLTIGNVLSPTVSNSTFNGVLAGTNLSFVKSGSGTLTLGGSASNTFSGSAGAVINSGTVILAKTGGAVAISTNLTLGSANGSAGTAVLQMNGGGQIASTASVTINEGSSMNLNGYNQAIGNLNGTPSSTVLNNATGTNATLTVGSNDATGGQFLGTIADNSSGTGTVALTKTGGGTALLGGWNTYSGATLVQGGTLQVGGSGIGSTGTGAVTVQNGATILGTGTVQGSSFTAASGSTIQAGDSIAQASLGTLTFKPVSGSGAIDFQSGSTIILNITSGGTSDLLNIIGTGSNTLLFNDNLTIAATGFVPTVPMVFNLLDWSGLSASPIFASRFIYTGSLFGNGDEASGLDLPDVSGTAGFYWDISQFTTNGIIILAPEPSRMLLLGLSLLMLLIRRRR